MIKLWRRDDVDQGLICVSTLQQHTDEVTCLVYNPLNNTLYTGSWDKAIKIWQKSDSSDALTCKNSFSGCSNNAYCMVFDSTTNILYTAAWKTIKVWKVSRDGSNLTLVTRLNGHTHQVMSLAYDSSTHTLYSASLDTTIKAWTKKEKTSKDGSTERICSMTLRGHKSGVRRLYYDSANQSMYSTGEDLTCKLWKKTLI